MNNEPRTAAYASSSNSKGKSPAESAVTKTAAPVTPDVLKKQQKAIDAKTTATREAREVIRNSGNSILGLANKIVAHQALIELAEIPDFVPAKGTDKNDPMKQFELQISDAATIAELQKPHRLGAEAAAKEIVAAIIEQPLQPAPAADLANLETYYAWAVVRNYGYSHLLGGIDLAQKAAVAVEVILTAAAEGRICEKSPADMMKLGLSQLTAREVIVKEGESKYHQALQALDRYFYQQLESEKQKWDESARQVGQVVATVVRKLLQSAEKLRQKDANAGLTKKDDEGKGRLEKIAINLEELAKQWNERATELTIRVKDIEGRQNARTNDRPAWEEYLRQTLSQCAAKALHAAATLPNY